MHSESSCQSFLQCVQYLQVWVYVRELPACAPGWISISALPAAIKAMTLCGVCANVPLTKAANARVSTETVESAIVLMNLVTA